MDRTNSNLGTLLSREEAKAINAGYGSGRCQLFCCTSPGTCPGKQIPVIESVPCDDDRQCQGIAYPEGASCSSNEFIYGKCIK